MRAWLLASHPFPLFAVVCLTALIAIVSSDGELDASRVALLLLAMLASQLAIGWSNDYLDRHLDAIHQPWKPIPSGRLDPRRVPLAILVALAFSLAAGAALGLLTLLFLLLGTAAGLVYNLALKDTRLSPVPYLVALAVLPPYIWAATDTFRTEFLALYPVTASLPVAAHIVNVLPDLQTDRLAGRGTLAVALGRGRSLAVLAVCLLIPPIAVLLSIPWIEYEVLLLGSAVAGYAGLVSLALFLLRFRSGRDSDVWAFRLVVAGSILFAVGWLASV